MIIVTTELGRMANGIIIDDNIRQEEGSWDFVSTRDLTFKTVNTKKQFSSFVAKLYNGSRLNKMF